MVDDNKKLGDAPKEALKESADDVPKEDAAKEIGGFEKREEPTRYGDWEVNGRCSDF